MSRGWHEGVRARPRTPSRCAGELPVDLQSRLTLNNGTAIPLLGLGTWQIANGGPAAAAVVDALRIGYRHIDTASIYGNEEDIGEGIRRSGTPREHVWVTTKLWNDDQPRASPAFERSLARLGLEYVDLYLVHWPSSALVTRTWRAMEDLCADGRCRAIGVSNHSVDQLTEILRVARIPPAVNQIQFSPFGFDQALADFCREHEIAVEAYSPLTKGRQLSDRGVLEIAQAYRRSPAQILIRWALQKGTIVLPKSAQPTHMEENARVFDFEITTEDMRRLDLLSV